MDHAADDDRRDVRSDDTRPCQTPASDFPRDRGNSARSTVLVAADSHGWRRDTGNPRRLAGRPSGVPTAGRAVARARHRLALRTRHVLDPARWNVSLPVAAYRRRNCAPRTLQERRRLDRPHRDCGCSRCSVSRSTTLARDGTVDPNRQLIPVRAFVIAVNTNPGS